MARAATEDPLKNFRFRVVVDGIQRAGFSEQSGLKQTTEEIKYREGGFNETSQKSAGLSEFDAIVLKRGLIVGSARGGDFDFAIWAHKVFDVTSRGNAVDYRRDLTIEQYSVLNQLAIAWTVSNAWPKEYVPTSDNKGDGNENSVESLTLSNEGFIQTFPTGI